MKERWWTAPMEADNGRNIIVTGRDYLDKIIDSGKYAYLVRVTWNYESDPTGMPVERDAKLMGEVTDALLAEFKRDKTAYLTGIYTGDGKREWIFHAQNLNIFGRVFNRALEDIETIPIEIEAESDPDWEEYKEMRELSYIPETDDED